MGEVSLDVKWRALDLDLELAGVGMYGWNWTDRVSGNNLKTSKTQSRSKRCQPKALHWCV